MARKMKTMDGNTAAAHVSYAFTDVAAIYPITPSSVMAELSDKWAAASRKNIFGQEVKVTEMQSEAGAAGAVHGSLSAGALTTTFTASQGLLLMIPNMYKIAGELLPSVIHVSARTVATHALNIFGDHSDVMACRQTGYAMMAATNAQEVMDLGAVSHLATIKGRVPVLHFFDGFRTSHEMQKIEIWDYEDLNEMVDHDAINTFRRNALNPEHPVLRGTAQNFDIFFQAREACNTYYNDFPAIVEEYMDKVNAKIGTDYKLFNYYGAPDADRVIIAMGSVCDTAEEVIDYMNANGEKVGLLKVRLYRPFVSAKFVEALPATCKKIAVLDRTKEPGSQGEPLYLDVVTALAQAGKNDIKVVGGRYGLGSKDTTPPTIFATFANLAGEMKNNFTIGIVDDVTNLSLEAPAGIPDDVTPDSIVSCKFWGLGADGTVGANKNSIKIIGDNTDMNAQAYFAYDSKKSGGVTLSHLRFGNEKIKATYLINRANFVACHNPSYVGKYEMVQDLKKGGDFLLNCPWSAEELEERLPAADKKYIAENGINLYTIDGIGLAREIGLGGRINMILQAAFFKISNIIPIDTAIKSMKDAIVASYGKKGEKVVNMNNSAVDAGIANVTKVEVPASWATATGETTKATITGDRQDLVDYVENVLTPVNLQLGDRLPVSTFMPYVDGTVPQGSAAYEKRGIGVTVPCWQKDNCIQCNQCALVCPHAVIRPFVANADEASASPLEFIKMTGKGCEEYQFNLSVSVLDCTGCGACAQVCPAKEKALVMKDLDSQMPEQANFDYAVAKISDKDLSMFAPETVKGSQFKQPLLEFSGACAGCGETPYAKLVTQLFGDRMYIANATGCSSIWGGSAPATPYTVNKKGKGPAWSNSLFEDNAEFGYGMFLAVTQMRDALKMHAEAMIAGSASDAVKAAAKNWIDNMYDSKVSGEAGEALVSAIKASGSSCTHCNHIVENADFLGKKSIWMFGGDGWAYDIGFGGLDHVIASNEDVNIFVFDTEVYSNTGGQASKATPTGSVAQFAASGKETAKKSLAEIAMSYGYVYVAQIAMGASYAQTVKAIAEAESYRGPSIVIAYAPCINHGIKKGMACAQQAMKEAVDAGYWHLFRFDPRKKETGENPFTLDSKAPKASYMDFINSETRYTSLKLQFPERAEELFKQAEKQAAERFRKLDRMTKLYSPEAE